MRLNGENYLEFLQEELPELLEDVPLDVRRRMWFQHDGAPAHSTRIVRDWLDQRFPGRRFGRRGPVSWPPRSPDLNPLDFFLWGHVKAYVYGRTRPYDLEDLRARIDVAMATVTEDMVSQAFNNMIVRARKCIELRIGQFEHLL